MSQATYSILLVDGEESILTLLSNHLKTLGYRVDTAQNGEETMGLFITHGIIEALGGTIDEKNKPGKGTLFTIKLPVQREINHDDSQTSFQTIGR